MAVSSLQEITLGVRDLQSRVDLFEAGCGLSVLRRDSLASMTASRLFDTHTTPKAALLGRPDLPGSPRLRLVQVAEGAPARPLGLASSGPLGTGFTTLGIDGVHNRLQGAGVRFVSPPILLTPMAPAVPGQALPGPRRFEAFGRAEDGDFIVLIERINAAAPYGTFASDCSEPLHASFVVTNLEATLHFMRDVLEHEVLLADTCAGPPFDALLGMPPDVSFRFAMLHRPGYPTGRTVFMEFQSRPEPMPQTPGLTPGLCRLRYDTTDLHATLARVPGGGGSLARGPASVDDPVLGHGIVAMVRAPFGVLIELWQTR
jgi:catechol 2,3-dioxygenase-like lactoylglutathione lyase family enzyme